MPSKKTPEVLILLAAYDGNRYIREQIDSILAQDYEDWLLVLSDDGEKTSEILDELPSREAIRKCQSALCASSQSLQRLCPLRDIFRSR